MHSDLIQKTSAKEKEDVWSFFCFCFGKNIRNTSQTLTCHFHSSSTTATTSRGLIHQQPQSAAPAAIQENVFKFHVIYKQQQTKSFDRLVRRTAKRVSSLFFTRKYSFLTWCRHLRHLEHVKYQQEARDESN